jgi:truncated hemoglobin YjbI
VNRTKLVLWACGVVTMMGCSSNDGGPPLPAPAPSSSTSTLYDRLGGHSGIRNAVNAVVAAELKDQEIAGFFGTVGQPGHPTADQIEECLTDQLGNAAGGPESYPTSANGWSCRDMATAHAGLHIDGTTFDKFVSIAAGVLKSAGVADADIQTIGGVLNGTESTIVDPNALSPATLYGRLGGHAGIRNAVNAVVAAELKDTEIAGFFGSAGLPGHPSPDQIEECLTDQLGHAAGGPEAYPTTADGWMCRDMATAHKGLGISTALFDKFVTIAAGVLKSAGVSDADIQTIGGVLNGTESTIVDPAAG